MLARLGMQAEYGTKDIMENPDFSLDFLLFGKGCAFNMKKCRFQDICERVHHYEVKKLHLVDIAGLKERC